LGGILTSALSWRWVLFVNVPIGVLVAIAAPRVLARSARQAGTRLDIPGSAAATAGMTALVYGLVRAPVDGWGDPITYASFAAAFVLLAAFVVIEARSDHPTLPFGLLKDRNRSASYIIMFALAGGIFAVFYLPARKAGGRAARRPGFGCAAMVAHLLRPRPLLRDPL
jgi:hypothetical protein